MSCEDKVITIVEHKYLPRGSVLQNCVPVRDDDGELCWSGLWCSMYGSYHEVVRQDDCEIWSEEKHDPTMFLIRKHLEKVRAENLEVEERATLARLKLKYEGA